jgi:hypothetical protein
MTGRTSLAIVALVALLSPERAGAADAPAWLQELARAPEAAPARDPRAEAVVLLDDIEVLVSDDGRSVTTRRKYAARILTRGGAAAASLREIYTTDAGRVRTLRAWIVADGRAEELGRAQVIDASLAENDVYNESRARIITAGDLVEPGMIFGAESEVTERTVFTQFDWWLQGEWPVRTLRRTLILPAGWDARSLTLNGPALEPVRSGASLTLARQNLEAVADEPAAPPFASRVARLAVTFFDTRRGANTFDSWPTVSRWLAALTEPRGAATADVTARARQLAGGATSFLDRVGPIATHAQRVQYISIQTGIGRGGGYVPRTPAEVLAKNYGDCKDKANLMRAMLASIGIQAHLVTIYAGDPDYVREQWPSPQQFNHAIVAIAAPSDLAAPAVVEHPSLGRLLLFDPTDPYTPLGHLPLHEQGSLALIVHGEGGPLVRVPSAPSRNGSQREIEGRITPDGLLVARLRLARQGDPARQQRAMRAAMPDSDYRTIVETELRRGFAGARVTASDVAENAEADTFDVSLDFAAPSFAQVLPGALLVVRPPQLAGGAPPALPAGPRVTPIVLDARDETDRLRLDIPDGMKVEDLPKPLAVDSPFGQFRLEWTTQGARVERTLQLRMPRSIVPPERHDELRAFLDAVRSADRATVVLTR